MVQNDVELLYAITCCDVSSKLSITRLYVAGVHLTVAVTYAASTRSPSSTPQPARLRWGKLGCAHKVG